MFLPREQRGSMIDISDSERCRAFSMWLRTGRLPSVRNADGIELKFNPWHDPENGRFTFASAGRRYAGASGKSGGGGGGAAGSGDLPARPPQPKPQRPAGRATSKDRTRSTAPADSAASSAAVAPGTWAGGGFSGGGGGSSGGAGASGTWGPLEPKLRPRSSSGSAATVVFRVNLWRRARLPHHLRARRASNFARLFATAIFTR
jgi:hypothetical protein